MFRELVTGDQEETMPMRSRRSAGRVARRSALTVAAAAAVSMALAACGSASGSGNASSSAASSAKPGATNVTMWLVTTGPSPANTAIANLAAAFDKSHPGDHISVDFVENQSFKTK